MLHWQLGIGKLNEKWIYQNQWNNDLLIINMPNLALNWYFKLNLFSAIINIFYDAPCRFEINLTGWLLSAIDAERVLSLV